ncbi:hypothetical protein V8C86DRAFT_2727888 [Haematococcus lacustris]
MQGWAGLAVPLLLLPGAVGGGLCKGGGGREFLLLFKHCTSSRLTPADVHIAFHRARSETSLLGEGLAPCGSACSCSCGCKCMTPGLTHDQFLFALTLTADKLGVPVRMTRAAKEPRKTESARQPGGDLLARVKHVFAFYALCGGGTDEVWLCQPSTLGAPARYCCWACEPQLLQGPEHPPRCLNNQWP